MICSSPLLFNISLSERSERSFVKKHSFFVRTIGIPAYRSHKVLAMFVFIRESYPQIGVLNICVKLSVKGANSLYTHLKIKLYFRYTVSNTHELVSNSRVLVSNTPILFYSF